MLDSLKKAWKPCKHLSNKMKSNGCIDPKPYDE
jgi:hypothetical protein